MTAGAPSSRFAFVSMVQASSHRKCDDPTSFESLHWPWLRGILVQSKVRSALVIVRHEENGVATQAALGDDDHVIQAFAGETRDPHQPDLPRLCE